MIKSYASQTVPDLFENCDITTYIYYISYIYFCIVLFVFLITHAFKINYLSSAIKSFRHTLTASSKRALARSETSFSSNSIPFSTMQAFITSRRSASSISPSSKQISSSISPSSKQISSSINPSSKQISSSISTPSKQIGLWISSSSYQITSSISPSS